MKDDFAGLIVEKMLKNPKVLKAMKGIVDPLEQEGDSLTIKSQEKEK